MNLSLIKNIFIYTLIIILSVIPLYALAETECNLNGAEYVPQNPEKEKTFNKAENVFNRTISLVMKIEEIKSNCHQSEMCIYLNFNAYDNKGQKVSSMRLADASSNGFARTSFDALHGQYSKIEGWSDFKPAVNFSPIGINKNLTSADIRNTPELIIFPRTLEELNYNSYQHPENWDRYIKFYTKDRIYPDFRNYDFWVRKKCGEKNNGRAN